MHNSAKRAQKCTRQPHRSLYGGAVSFVRRYKVKQDGTVINMTSHPSAGLPVTAYPPRTILAGVVGSQAYGLAHAGSDVDTVGVFICDTHELLGIDGAQAAETTLVSHHPDAQFHEIGKFVQLALKGSPGAIELLSLPSHTQLLPAGATLVNMRPRLLSTDTVPRSNRAGIMNAGNAATRHSAWCVHDVYRSSVPS